MANIREVNIEKNENGEYKKVSLVFGPHYFFELQENEGKISVRLGATHHGFQADASEVGGELDGIISAIRENYPENQTDNFR